MSYQQPPDDLYQQQGWPPCAPPSLDPQPYRVRGETRPAAQYQPGLLAGTNGYPDWDAEAPSSARVSDCLLGGWNHRPSDEDVAAELEWICPGVRQAALTGREFLARAVTWAARQGIAQFIDLGCGSPVAAEYDSGKNQCCGRPDADTHAVARAVNPDAAVAYVDRDPMVALDASVLLEPAGPGIAVAGADLRDPEKVLADPGLQQVISPEQPVCVILGLVLHYMSAAQARDAVAGYARLIARGSCVVISTARFDDPGLFARIWTAYTPAPLYNHSRAQVASFFSNLDLVPPGVRPAAGLRPGWGDAPGASGKAYVLGGIGRKP